MYPTLSDSSNNKEKLCKWLRAAVARSPYRYPSALEIICELGLVNGETPLLIEFELSQTRASSNGETPFFVCCDGCRKWRIWPYSHRFEINIDVPWYCSMNVHDMLRNSCDGPLEDGCTREELPQRVKGGLFKGTAEAQVNFPATRLGSSSVQIVTTQSNTETDIKPKRGTKWNIFCNAVSISKVNLL